MAVFLPEVKVVNQSSLIDAFRAWSHMGYDNAHIMKIPHGQMVDLYYTQGKLTGAYKAGHDDLQNDVEYLVRDTVGIPEEIPCYLKCVLRGWMSLPASVLSENAVMFSNPMDYEACANEAFYGLNHPCHSQLEFVFGQIHILEAADDIGNIIRSVREKMTCVYSDKVRINTGFSVEAMRRVYQRISSTDNMSRYTVARHAYNHNARMDKNSVYREATPHWVQLTVTSSEAVVVRLGRIVNRVTMHDDEGVAYETLIDNLRMVNMGIKHIGDRVMVDAGSVHPRVMRVLESNPGIPLELTNTCPCCGHPVHNNEWFLSCVNRRCTGVVRAYIMGICSSEVLDAEAADIADIDQAVEFVSKHEMPMQLAVWDPDMKVTAPRMASFFSGKRSMPVSTAISILQLQFITPYRAKQISKGLLSLNQFIEMAKERCNEREQEAVARFTFTPSAIEIVLGLDGILDYTNKPRVGTLGELLKAKLGV